MPRIKKLHVYGYRGITKEVNLPLEGKSLILFGESGTGKSSFVEAIEKLLTGKVASLDGHMGLSSDKHGPSIKVPRTDSEIEITFDDGSIFSLDSSTNSFPAHINNYLAAARQPLFVLRRAQILQLIEKEPRERGDLLEPFLPISEWNEVEDAFKQSHDTADQRASESRRALNNVVSKLSEFLESPLPWGAVTEQALIESINRRLSKDSFPIINKAQEIQEALQQVEQNLSSLGDIPTHITFHNMASQLETITPDLQIDWLSALLKEIHELRSQEQAQAHLFFEEVLQKGLEWIEQAELDYCPLCEKTFDDKVATVESIKHRLSEMEELITARRNVDEARRIAISNLTTINEKLSAIEDGASTVERKDVTNLALEFRDWVQKTSDILSSKVSDIKIQELAEAVDFWTSQNFPARFSKIREELKEILSIIPTPDAIQPLLDLKGFLSQAQQLWQEQESLRVKSEQAQRIARIAERAFKYAEQSRKEEIQTIFDQVAKDIDRLYAKVNQDENRGGIQLKVRDVATFSVNLRHNFYDRKGEDPRAYSNEADLDISGLCIFLALCRWYRNQHSEFNLLILDDVLTSIDAEHRVRFAELLMKEFKNYQILLTTHDRIWFEYLRDIQARCGVSQQFISKIIHKWSIDEGPDLREPQEERDRLEQLMEAGEPSQIASEAGRLLEHILQEMRYNLPLAVQARRGERYEIGDLWPAFYRGIRKEYTGFYNEAQSCLESLDIRWQLRNWVGAHFNDWAKGINPNDAKEFGRAVADLFDLSFCTECRRFIQPSITPEGQTACRCGHLIYPPFGREARPPKDMEDVLKITLGALSDTRLTTGQYLEWKRAEIGAEN